MQRPPQGASAAPRRARLARWHNPTNNQNPFKIYGVPLVSQLDTKKTGKTIQKTPTKTEENTLPAPLKSLKDLWRTTEIPKQIYGVQWKSLRNVWRTMGISTKFMAYH